MVEILPTKADQEKAITKLQEKGASLGFIAKKARDRLPRLIITGVPGDFNRENIIENLKTSNSNISQILDANPAEQLKLVALLSTRHRFIPQAAAIMRPLFQALAGKNKPNTLEWSEEMKAAFERTKQALTEATLLTHPRGNAPTSLTVDASDITVGGVLEQKINGKWYPLAFFSKQLSSVERKYSAFDRELLALHISIKHFRYFLEG